MVAYNTPLEIIEELRSRISAYVAENNREWSGFGLNIDKMEYQNAIHLIVAMERMLCSPITDEELKHSIIHLLTQIVLTGKTGVDDGPDAQRSCGISVPYSKSSTSGTPCLFNPSSSPMPLRLFPTRRLGCSILRPRGVGIRLAGSSWAMPDRSREASICVRQVGHSGWKAQTLFRIR